nr:hypothetical protein Hi04_10k_c1000_00028 [uncultured bacterium]
MRRSMSRETMLSLLLTVLVAGTARASTCDVAGTDAAAVAATRADIAAQCDCSGFTPHRAYVRCAAPIIAARVQNAQLPPACKGVVHKAVTASACGKPAAVTCCVLTTGGTSRCRVTQTEGSCSGGTTCVGAFSSCSDACDPLGCVPASPRPPQPTPTPCTGGSCPTTIQTVFIILMENHDWASIKNNPSAPYLNGTLLPMASHAEQYYNPPNLHPSEPNYLWLEAGTNFGILDDAPPVSNHRSAPLHLVNLLDAAGISWRAYQEDTSGTVCPLSDLGDYAVRHDPFVFFDDVTDANDAYAARCIAHVRPYAELATDLSNNTVAQYNFITPNVCNDMHDACDPLNDPVQQGDAWLSREVPTILSSAAYSNGGALFITWDEAENGDGPIGMLVLSSRAKGGGYANTIAYTHSSTLRTVEEIFGVTPLLGDAATATDLADLFVTFP